MEIKELYTYMTCASMHT